jgi:N-acetyl sugar amidotransferase
MEKINSVPPRFLPENYQQCSVTVLDNIEDPNISFDENGVSNYVHDYKKIEKNGVFLGADGKRRLDETIKKIKNAGKGKKYDCILGVSGGVDSSYTAYLAAQLGLRALCVHFDNGWNSELAVHNIENIVNRCNFDLYTHVFNWEEFKDIQLSHFRANVVDIEAITDLAIGGTIRKIALQNDVKYMVSGVNIQTEAILPSYWICKDFHNVIDIHKKFGSLEKITTFPYFDSQYDRLKAKFKGIETVSILDFAPYNKKEAKQTIIDKLNWRDYGGKHYESIFTRFYQGYILPMKFGIDKRKAHLSNLIVSGQMTKAEAVEELKLPIISSEQLKTDYDFVIKKLGFTIEEFEKYINAPRKEHSEYETSQKLRENNLVRKIADRVFN